MTPDSERRLTKSDDKLGVIRIFFAIVRHCNKTTMGEPQSRVNFIFERLSIERLSTSTSTSSVTGLNKKVRYNPVGI